ncbi:MAG: S41 family peptidase, partial [Pseudomonadota bacterium]
QTIKMLTLFGEVFENIKRGYVKEVDDTELIEAALKGMLQSLDPYSDYINPQQQGEVSKMIKGEFGGLGVEVTLDRGTVKVIAPLDGGPAARVGIMSGDYIVKADDESLFGIGLNGAVEKLKGKAGSKVRLTIIREGDPEPKEFVVTRETIKVTSVRGEMFNDIAYLRLSIFNEQTPKSIISEWKKLNQKHKNIKGLIIDVRSNPGGLFKESLEICDYFLDSGEIVSVVERKDTKKKVFKASKGDITGGIPMAVMIDQGSASASEILAGALQDQKRAIVVGSKSFGKGSVQQLVELKKYNSILKITYAKYLTPSGRSIHEKGIDPDIEIKPAKLEFFDQSKPQDNELFNKYGDQLKSSQQTKAESLQQRQEFYQHDYVLARTVDLLKGVNTFKQIAISTQ